MRTRSISVARVALAFLALAVLPLPNLNPFLHSAWAQTACTYSLGGCQCNCDGLSGLPPQNPPQRTYDTFIIRAYQGAYGRNPTCFERQNEYWNLVDASSSSSLLTESRRFVATLFMTQSSYDIPGIDPNTYTQTSAYEQRRPSWQTDRVTIEAFVGDLYRAFLQRSPDPGGQCFWSNNVCSEGRKKGIRAFEVSIEFGNLVNGLFDGGEPCPVNPQPCRPGRVCPEL